MSFICHGIKKRISKNCHSRAGCRQQYYVYVNCNCTKIFKLSKKTNSIQVNTDLTRIFSFFTQVVNFKQCFFLEAFAIFSVSVEEVTSIRFSKKRMARLLITSFALIFVSVMFLSQAKETVGKVKKWKLYVCN